MAIALLGDGSAAAYDSRLEAAPPVFRNPIVATGADPWVIYHQGFYYYCSIARDDGIQIAKAQNLHEIGLATPQRVWRSPPGTDFSSQVWAPELHFLDGRWYIYFAASRGDNASHRMYVLESEGADPLGTYFFKGKIAAATDRWAIDGTVWEPGDGKRYFLWSGWDEGHDVQQNLYIAPMINPWTLKAPDQPFIRMGAEQASAVGASLRVARWASDGRALRFTHQAQGHAEFSLTVPSAGSYQLDVRFANAAAVVSSHQLQVNDEPSVELLYPVLGDDNFQTIPVFVTLRAGVNRLRFSPGRGQADLDRIEVKPIGSDRVLLSMPEHSFEKRGGPPYVNEGPQILQRNGKTHIIYSGSGSWGDDYNLIRLSFQGGDPLNRLNWQKSGPVFARTEDVFSPGHASFTQSPDQSEDWIVYHAAKYQGAGWNRDVRMQRFHWDAMDTPVFGPPLPLDMDIPVPRRQAAAAEPKREAAGALAPAYFSP